MERFWNRPEHEWNFENWKSDYAKEKFDSFVKLRSQQDWENFHSQCIKSLNQNVNEYKKSGGVVGNVKELDLAQRSFSANYFDWQQLQLTMVSTFALENLKKRQITSIIDSPDSTPLPDLFAVYAANQSKFFPEKPIAKKQRVTQPNEEKKDNTTADDVFIDKSIDLIEEKYSLVIQEIKRVKELKDARKSLYWGALDLRPKPSLELTDNERAVDLLPIDEYDLLISHCEEAVTNARSKISKSALLFMSIVRSLWTSDEGQRQFTLKTCVDTYEDYGSVGVLEFLRKILQNLLKLSGEDAANCTVINELIADLNLIDSKDTRLRWMFRKLLSMSEKKLNQPFSDSTERTIDIFNLANFAKLPHDVKLRYGDGSSKADKIDKELRESESTRGKKVDYLFKKNGKEIGCGENSGGGKGFGKSSEDHVNENFIDSIKVISDIFQISLVNLLKDSQPQVNIAQIRKEKTRVDSELKAHDITPPPVIQDMFQRIFDPLFQTHDDYVRFGVVFNICSNLFGLYDYSHCKLPEEDTDVLEFLDVCESFMIYDVNCSPTV
ncbi:hypothetical protein HK098_001433 [Nowakowskiella sp. JEL0407]|nr:hypothetical protein HK098_001433 [Nowakowskiella sp. JEL0407]